jgi:uncharacterized protein YgbK (DUF1537 family)
LFRPGNVKEHCTTRATPEPRSSHWNRVCILADDLTGACDAAAAFLRTGQQVRIWFDAEARFSAREPVQSFNTASRALPDQEAAEVVSRAAAGLDLTPDTLIFKKVDSVARGPLAAELLAAQSALGTRAILLAPAFPAAGRTVCNGILEIEDVAGQHKLINLAHLFPSEIRSRIARLDHHEKIAQAIEDGATVLLCGATTQNELDDLVRVAEKIPGLLYAGSAGLAQAIANLRAPAASAAPAAPMPTAERVLLVVGSDHPVTLLQLSKLDREAFDGLSVLQVWTQRDRALIRRAFETQTPQALILTGGDTALLAVRALQAHSFILRGEVAPGIPWGIVAGGSADGCAVVTKSGGFGAPSAFNDILAAFRGSL